MNDTRMPSPEELRRLLRGELEDDHARRLYLLLEENPEALELAEGIWADESPLMSGEPSRLSERRSERIERQIFLRVHRTDLAEDVAELSGGAFLHVVLGLLSAMFSIVGVAEPSPPSKRRSP